MVHVLVVEDHIYECKRIVQILQEAINDVKIYEAPTGKEALHILKKHQIDLFLLDIELPDQSGLNIAEEIRKIPQYEFTYIVFITTHVYLQLEAFKKIHCYDFIEKPYEKRELMMTVQKLMRGIMIRERDPVKESQKVKFELRNCTLTIPLDEILYIESQKRNCVIHTKNRQYEISNYTMKKMLDNLPNDYFMQCHKSYIINMKKVKEVDKEGRNAWIVYFTDYDSTAYISNKYKEKFYSHMIQIEGSDKTDEMV